jgi:hypothetical protein
MMTVVMGISCMGMPIAGVLLGPPVLSMACVGWQQQGPVSRGLPCARVCSSWTSRDYMAHMASGGIHGAALRI